MAELDTGHGQRGGLTRRGFLQTAAAATVAGCAFDAVWNAEAAQAYEGNAAYEIHNTTCPYCSASCGQRVVVTSASHPDGAGKVIDLYGDFESPMNSGGLCAKGAGSLQLATNDRRIGAYAGPHAVKNMDGSSDSIFAYDSSYTDGIAYKRTGNGNWAKMNLDTALGEIATGAIAARNSDTALWNPAAGAYNSKGIAFFGSSHMNNESNYIYRKLIATFGTSNTEHQARI